jgi:hypothetical protein
LLNVANELFGIIAEILEDQDHNLFAHYCGLNVTNLLLHFKAVHAQAEQGGAREVRRKLEAAEGSPPIKWAKDDFVIMYGGKAPGAFASTDGTVEWRGVWDRQFDVLRDGSVGGVTSRIVVKEPENTSTANAKQVGMAVRKGRIWGKKRQSNPRLKSI